MATVSLCSSLATSIVVSSNKQAPTLFCLSKDKDKPFAAALTFLSHSLSSSLTLSSSSSSYLRPTLPFAPKFSRTETEPSSVEESAVSNPTTQTQLLVPQTPHADEQQLPKREDVFAVVMVGGRQYIVFPGRYICTQRLKGANVNDRVILNKVLLVGTKTSAYIGYPLVPNAAVHAVVEEQGLDKKVIVFKYKKKKNYRRNIGHRQPNTRLRILGITGYEDSPAATLPQ